MEKEGLMEPLLYENSSEKETLDACHPSLR